MVSRLVLLVILALFPCSLFAQTNTTLQYQGSLFDSQGAPVTTNKTITFRLFNDAETGESGDALWTETLAVDIAEGFFTVPLGSVNAFDESTFRETELWLELEIDSETLSPRQPVAAVPWARRAFSVEGKVEATSITSEGSVTVGGSEVINASGQWVGSTQTATDLNCSGCVDTSEVSFNVCIADESGNAAYADEAGTATMLDCMGCVVASQLADDYTTAVEVEAMIGDLPADGLSEVSNGILDNVLSQTHHATDVPKTITDHFPAGINSTIAIPTTGTIRSVSVAVDITHTDIGELQIKLFPPVGGVITLHDQGQTSMSDLSTTYPTETVPAAGSFDNLMGTSPNGNWTLQIIDDVENLEGILNTWAVNIEYISDIDITLDGNLNVTGNLDITGTLMKGGIEAALVNDERFLTVEEKNGLLPFSGFERIGHIQKSMYSQSNLASSNFILPYNQSEGTVSLEPGIPHYFQSLQVSDGVLTSTEPSSFPLILIIAGNCDINGKIDLKGKGSLGGLHGGGMGENGGNGSGPQVQTYYSVGGGGGRGGLNASSSGGTMSPGYIGGPITQYYDFQISEVPDDLEHLWNVFSGPGGGAGGRGGLESAGGDGGNGGGALILMCNGNVTITGEIDLSGENGQESSYYSNMSGGGGGGGAGGTLVLAYGGEYENSGMITVSGGAGSPGKSAESPGNGAGGGGGSGPGGSGTSGIAATETRSGDGGDGGDGKVYIFQMPQP